MKKSYHIVALSLALSSLATVEYIEAAVITPSKIPSTTPPAPIAQPSSGPNLRTVKSFKLIQECEQGKDTQIHVQSELQSRIKQLQDLDKERQNKIADLQKMGSLASDKAKEAAAEEIMKLETSIKIKQNSLQEYQERASQEALRSIGEAVHATVEEYAKKHNIDIIISDPLYANEKYDITEVITQEMNKKYTASKKKEEPKK